MSGTPKTARGYVPFPDVPRRNLLQQNLEIPLMVRGLKLGQGLRLLEVGCGRGMALEPLSRLCRPNALAGIDVDPSLIRIARENARRSGIDCTLRTADVRNLPFEDGCFDVVVDFGTCYHIAHPELALAEIGRVLAPGGRFVYETRLSQMLSHPIRSLGKAVPLSSERSLESESHRLLWASRWRLAAPA